jgi:hypothetical protein
VFQIKKKDAFKNQTLGNCKKTTVINMRDETGERHRRDMSCYVGKFIHGNFCRSALLIRRPPT